MFVVIAVLKDIIKTESVRGLYRGWGASVLVYTPNSAIWWASYATFKDAISSYLARSERMTYLLERENSFIVHGISGTMAGTMAAVLTNPLDVAKTRIQVSFFQQIVF